MKRFLGIFLGILFTALLGALYGSLSANAASIYDDLYNPTDELVVKRLDTPVMHPCTEEHDLTLSYGGFILDYDNWDTRVDESIRQTVYNNYLDRVAWSVGNTKSPPEGYNNANQAIYFHFTTSSQPQADLYWTDYGEVIVSDSYSLTIGFSRKWGGSSCDLIVRPESGTGNRLISRDTSTMYLDNLFTYNYNIVYPEDYEGIIPPETSGPPLIVRDIIAPDFTYDYNEKTINAKDHVNDLIPEFVPDEGYTSDGPEVRWTIWKCSEDWVKGVCPSGDSEIINMVHKPLNEGVTWTVEEFGSYKIEAEYSLQQCYRYASYPATPDHCFYVSMTAEFGDNYIFERRSKEFNLDGTSGSGDTIEEDCDIMGSCSSPASITGGMMPCFTSDFPYVDVPGCVTNVFWIVDSLTFSKVTIMDIKSNTLECKQLNTVGAWIHKPGITVCPMFPAHVRDVVTPFVTFAFVLMLAGFLMRLGSDRR